MLTIDELLRALLVPAVVAAMIAAVGRWRGWTWAMPLALGAGFVAGYATFGIPKLPPRDGTDWLFWLAIPLALLGVMDATALRTRRWGWLLGAAAAGVAAWVVVRPLTPGAVTPAAAALAGAGFAVAAAGVLLLARWAEPAIGSATVVAALAAVAGGAGVVVLSSNLRIVGIYGLAVAAALGAVAVLIGRNGRAGHVATAAVPLVAALLAGGRFYPEPGVAWLPLVVLTMSPALLAIGALVPDRFGKVRGVVALLAVSLAVAAATVPVALTAKQEAEEDPYAAYK